MHFLARNIENGFLKIENGNRKWKIENCRAAHNKNWLIAENCQNS
jgi:hypothetical protein